MHICSRFHDFLYNEKEWSGGFYVVACDYLPTTLILYDMITMDDSCCYYEYMNLCMGMEFFAVSSNHHVKPYQLSVSVYIVIVMVHPDPESTCCTYKIVYWRTSFSHLHDSHEIFSLSST